MFYTLVISKGRVKIFDDISQTSGTPFVSGINGNSTPKIYKQIKII